MGKLRETAAFFTRWAANKPVVWYDVQTGARAHTDTFTRRDYWHIFMPSWLQQFATIGKPCGCRKRFGLLPTLTCSKHMPKELELVVDEEGGLPTWPCMVCGDWRPDEQISVAYRALPESIANGLKDSRVQAGPWNVRYCNDRASCIEYATMDGPWTGPPAKDS